MAGKEAFQQIQQGDERGWETLYKSFPYYVTLLVRRGIPHQEAQDIVQDRYVKLLEKKDSLDMTRAPGSLLWNMIQNKGTDYLRKPYSRDVPLSGFTDDDDRTGQYVNDRVLIDHNQMTPEDIVIFEDEALRGLQQMSPPQQRVILMAGEGFTQEAIAALEHVPLGTVKTRIRLGQGRANGERNNAA